MWPVCIVVVPIIGLKLDLNFKEDTNEVLHTEQSFSTFVRPRHGKFYFHKTRALSQQIYS